MPVLIDNCTTEGRGGEKGESAKFKTNHKEPMTFNIINNKPPCTTGGRRTEPLNLSSIVPEDEVPFAEWLLVALHANCKDGHATRQTSGTCRRRFTFMTQKSGQSAQRVRCISPFQLHSTLRVTACASMASARFRFVILFVYKPCVQI